MIPKYFNENRYSHLVARWPKPANVDYQAESPTSRFERRVQQLFLKGQRHLHHDEFALALDTFRELQATILATAHPKMPPDPFRIPSIRFPKDAAIINVLIDRAAAILKVTPPTTYKFPPDVVSEISPLPAAVQQKLKPALESELHVTSFHQDVFQQVERGLAAAEEEDWTTALRHYTMALQQTPATEKAIKGSLLHDLALINEKLNRKIQAERLVQQSTQLLAQARVPKAQVHALESFAGILLRKGKKPQADRLISQITKLRQQHNLFPVLTARPQLFQPITGIQPATRAETNPGPSSSRRTSRLSVARPAMTLQPNLAMAMAATPIVAPKAGATEVNPEIGTLMGLSYFPKRAEAKVLAIQGTDGSASIAIDRRATVNLKSFLSTLQTTTSLDLLTGYWRTPTQMVAYLPHMYFFVIPMAIGDCLAGLGNFEEAEEEYLSVLAYPFINRQYEIVQWWTRLADLYLEMGDEVYRRAKDQAAGWEQARLVYEKIVKANGSLDLASPLYKDQKLAAIRQRIQAFLRSADPVAFQENPRLMIRVLRAKSKLNQIQAGLNYFGMPPDYLPPFSFEYLQNTARYFAQQASQMEQQYIQYKSTAENEELRREQLGQQAEVARQTVVLEQRGVAEAQAGVGVAQASLNYAKTQRDNAVKAKQDFERVRWELLEYAEAEAWANAASMDEDDEIKQTWSGHYYSSKKRRRSLVLQDLAYRRTRLSHDLEAKKLQREIEAATAYMGIAQAQLAQAKARVAIAEQRVAIARLQQRQAEENRDFLDLKEFSARLWYELAREARQISRRYLDMAIEVAMLMERAYNAETERGIQLIRFDYGLSRTGDLLASDRLRQDIDYFTLDLVTTIKPKKSPVKKTFSLADRRPMAFHQLKETGRCFFQTELEDFDREHPGLYLCKLRNVELVFVGITGATSLAGTLRNVGISKFRTASGSLVTRQYTSDVLPLSQYDLRQDALAFRVTPNELRLFENSGIDTLWQLDLPRDANEFDLNEILDIQLVLYYDGLYSPNLESAVRNALPSEGSASRAFSLRLLFPDELFYLKNQGEARLDFREGMFPRNQVNLTRTDVWMKVSGPTAAGLTIRLTPSSDRSELVLKTDADGEVTDATPGRPLRRLRQRDVLETWTLRITKDDNTHLVHNDHLDLSGITDLVIFMEYTYRYR